MAIGELAKVSFRVNMTPMTHISGAVESDDHDVIAKDIGGTLGGSGTILGSVADWNNWGDGAITVPIPNGGNATIATGRDMAYIKNNPTSTGNVTVQETNAGGATISVLAAGEAIILLRTAVAIYVSCDANSTCDYTSMT